MLYFITQSRCAFQILWICRCLCRYHFWQAEATLQDNLQTLEKEEKEARLAASHLGEEVGGQVKENKMLYKKLSTEEKPESYFGVRTSPCQVKLCREGKNLIQLILF